MDLKVHLQCHSWWLEPWLYSDAVCRSWNTTGMSVVEKQ